AAKTFSSEESYTLPALKAGTYYWRMNSTFADAEKPLMGKVQKFSVKPVEQVQAQVAAPIAKPINPVQVSFTMPESQLTQYYLESPQVGLTWNVDKKDQIASFRVRISPEGEDPAKVTPVEVKENKLTTTVSKPGRYLASIEAVNKDGQVVGTSTSPALNVAPMPILEAPQFLPADEQLKSSPDGQTQLTWSKIEGAKEYWLTIKREGKELKHSKYQSTGTTLSNLLPGEYDLEISATDNYGRVSKINPSRKLTVPDKSTVRAPALKKIKVN
ncbi:MAG TPA: hypothetical protein VN132_00600, partial [Bdellovibrio sp.]|nr:hypothetical protein [Bdellovibrio sp.]